MLNYVILIAGIMLIAAHVYWADWIFREHLNEDFKNGIIFLVLFAIALAAPRSLYMLVSISLIIATLYIYM